MPTLTYKDNSKKFIKELKKVHGGLQTASANTVNTAGKVVERTYKKKLDKFTLRNKFTKGSVKILKATPRRGKGDFRQISKINSIVGVRKMKGGKAHYLLDQEEGGRNRGSTKTKGRTALPMDAARTSGSDRKPVRSAIRLQNVSTIRTLKIGGIREPARDFGLTSDRYKDKQRWAILYKYSGVAGSSGSNPYGWDLKKQFYFRGMNRGTGVFQLKGSRIKMTRQLGGRSVEVKGRHKFNKSFSRLTPKMMEAIFKREVERVLRVK